MAIRFSDYMLLESAAKDIKISISSMGYEDIKDISAKRFKIIVPAKERMNIAEKIASELGGKLATTGTDAGKPVVEFVGGIKLYVKPKPGSGVGGAAKEDMQLMSLQKQIQAELDSSDLMELPIKIGNKYYSVAGAASTPGTPKSDFHLLNLRGEEVVWISHKDGSKAKDFQQWGGMSARSEPEIANHPETKKFVEDVKAMVGDIMPNATTLSRKIVDQRLAGMSVYGNKFGSNSFSRQNVTLLLQGPVTLVKKPSYYEITSNHTSKNGDIMTEGYEPVFMVIYKGDRSDYKIRGARFSIQPADSRKSKEI